MLGYPAEPYPYNGYDMYSAAGDTYIAKFHPGMVYMYPNDMGEGVSGAPWICSVNGVTGYVNGVASCRLDGGSLLSPVFDDKVQRLWNSAQT